MRATGWAVLLALGMIAAQPAAAHKAAAEFGQDKTWLAAVQDAAGDAAALRGLYSTDPPAAIATPQGDSIDLEAEIEFWARTARSVRGWRVEDRSVLDVEGGAKKVTFALGMDVERGSGPARVYFSVSQVWARQNSGWRIVRIARTPMSGLSQRFLDERLYPETADADKELAEALAAARRDGKRVLIAFGANWCPDCHVLNAWLHLPEIAPLVERSYRVVHVDVGLFDRNTAIADRCGVPLHKGIPALAVLDSSGNVLYAQKNGEFESTAAISPADVVALLNQWKPQ